MPVPCFLLFLVSESYFWKYFQNCTKQKAKSLFFQHIHGVRRRHEGEPRGGQTTWRRGPLLPRQLVRRPTSGSTDVAPSPIYSPRGVNPKTRSQFPRRVPQRRRHRRQVSGDRISIPVPCRDGEVPPESSPSTTLHLFINLSIKRAHHDHV